MGFVLTMSFAVYTIIEAHAVSVYIARNYVLLLLGAYWPCMILGNEKKSALRVLVEILGALEGR